VWCPDKNTRIMVRIWVKVRVRVGVLVVSMGAPRVGLSVISKMHRL